MKYCMKCRKENEENVKQCECGDKSFLTGNITFTEKGFVCGVCGSHLFRKNGHMMMNPRYITTYQCNNCPNVIVTDVYYESPYL